MKQAIQTDLLGVEVIIGEETGTITGPTPEATGSIGTIRTVFTDKDGELRYTIQLKSGSLIDLYSCNFKILAPDTN